MPSRLLRSLQTLELEEQILNAGSAIAIIGIFLPWLSGEWLGVSETYNGLGFYTSFLGLAIFLIHLFLLLVTFLPLTGGPVLLRKRYREFVRLFLAFQAVVLVLGVLTVLTRVTFEFTRMEVRWGVYVTLIGSFVTLLYTFLRWQEHRRSDVQDLFHHPEDQVAPPAESEAPTVPPPPPPPPPAPLPEEHRIYP